MCLSGRWTGARRMGGDMGGQQEGDRHTVVNGVPILLTFVDTIYMSSIMVRSSESLDSLGGSASSASSNRDGGRSNMGGRGALKGGSSKSESESESETSSMARL